ncbi:hypothetical protein BJB45_08245 [Halomonas huangheensis]|uniref:Uncharacterized protein n=1 Tax=Halomonas huangheensis TaxID=1178482 RepID=W1NAL3_9GAMM|nr:hypothetical protein BJB45_08245 [Halomonas huangheensis]
MKQILANEPVTKMAENQRLLQKLFDSEELSSESIIP